MKKLLFAIVLIAIVLVFITDFNKEAFFSIFTVNLVMIVTFTGSKFVEDFKKRQG